MPNCVKKDWKLFKKLLLFKFFKKWSKHLGKGEEKENGNKNECNEFIQFPCFFVGKIPIPNGPKENSKEQQGNDVLFRWRNESNIWNFLFFANHEECWCASLLTIHHHFHPLPHTLIDILAIADLSYFHKQPQLPTHRFPLSYNDTLPWILPLYPSQRSLQDICETIHIYIEEINHKWVVEGIKSKGHFHV